MKKSVFTALLLAGFAATGCTHDDPTSNTHQPSPVTVDTTWLDTVVVSFSRPYEMSAMTRAVQPISDFCTHLDVWITTGSETTDYHQSSTDASFGTISAVLDKRKTYTIHAVAHKCATDATLSDGVISFPDDKLTQSLYYENTFTPSSVTSLSAEMQRIVAMFRVETTDNVSTDCARFRITVTGIFDRWNVASGGTHQIDRVSEISVPAASIGAPINISTYAIVTDAVTTHTVTLDALTADGLLIQRRTFADVGLRNGYRTIYRGAFFTDQSFISTFTAQDWQDNEVVEF